MSTYFGERYNGEKICRICININVNNVVFVLTTVIKVTRFNVSFFQDDIEGAVAKFETLAKEGKRLPQKFKLMEKLIQVWQTTLTIKLTLSVFKDDNFK